MKLYQIEGKHYLAVGDELYERLEVATIDARPTDPLADLAPSTVSKKAKQVRKYIPKKGYKKGTCGKCGEVGHSAWHCPKCKAANPEREAFKERILSESHKNGRCSVCGEPGHRKTTCPTEKNLKLTEDQIEPH